MIHIHEDGVVETIVLQNVSRGVNQIILPTKPLLFTLEARLDDKILPTLYDDVNNTLLIIAYSDGVAHINYLTEAFSKNNMFIINISRPIIFNLTIDPGVILMIDPAYIISSESYPNGTLKLIVKGPISLEYTIRALRTSTMSTTVYTTSSESITIISPQQPAYLIEILMITAVVIAILIIIFMIYVRRGRKSFEAEYLDKIDLAIINLLDKKGGSAFQSEIQKELLLPKTTLWRHIRRLERLGYIKIEKIGQVNKLILIKKPRS